jgi:hypothetical protein
VLNLQVLVCDSFERNSTLSAADVALAIASAVRMYLKPPSKVRGQHGSNLIIHTIAAATQSGFDV